MIKETPDFQYKLVKKLVKLKKPIRNKNGEMKFSDALKYLVVVLPQDDPSYDFILTLASFAVCDRLSEKQAKKANKIIWFYEKEGVL